MTVRQLWLRVQVIVQDPRSPLCVALREVQAKEEARQKSAALDDVHTRYTKRPRG